MLKPSNDITRAIGRTVVNNKNVETLIEIENCFNDAGNVFFFVVSRYDGDLFQLSRRFVLF
jgi:hypothetical protein